MSDLIQIESEPTFTTRLGDDGLMQLDPEIPRIGEADALIKIGGDSDLSKFIPNINAAKWDDEYFLNINTVGVPKGDVESFDNGKIIFERSGIQHLYYPTNKKRPTLEYEMIFASKPPSLEIWFDLFYSPGMTFTRQNIEDMEDSTYAPNVPGAYVIWVPEANNKYRTGQFGILYMPGLIDAVGRRIFVEKFEIESGRMLAVLPGKWMDEAVYPVTLDPEIGFHTVGDTHTAAGANLRFLVANITTDGTGGIVQDLVIYTENNTWGDVKLGAYDGIIGGVSSRIIQTEILKAAQSNGDWSIKDVSGQSVSLSANTQYPMVLVFISGEHGYRWSAGAGGEGGFVSPATYAAELANPLTGYNTSTRKPSMYLVYEPVAGGETVVIGKASLTSTGKTINPNAETVLSIAQASLTATGKAFNVNQAMLIQLARATMSHLGKAISVNDNVVVGKAALTATGRTVQSNMETYIQIAKAGFVATGKALKINTTIHIAKAAMGMVGRAVKIAGEVVRRRTTWLLYEALRKKE